MRPAASSMMGWNTSEISGVPIDLRRQVSTITCRVSFRRMDSSNTMARARPVRLASYIATSALRTTASASSSPCSLVTMPMLAVEYTSRPCTV